MIVSIELMEKQLKTCNEALKLLEACCEEISTQQATVELEINDQITQLHEILDVRKAELISKLNQICQDKLNSLSVQKNQMEISQAKLSSCLVRESQKKELQVMLKMK